MDEMLKIIVAAQDEASATIKKIAESLRDVKTTATLAGAALGALTLKKSISAFTDFQSAMKQSIAIMGDVSRAMEEKLMKKAIDVANHMAVSQEEVARAYYYLASAGLSAKESIEAVTEVAKLAVAAHMDMAEATDIAVNTMKAFGLTVQDLARVNDTLIATVTKSNTNLQQLGEAMKYVAPFAHQVGWSIEEVSAALGILANHGIKASQAGTYLRQAIAQLIKPTDSAKEAIERLGLTVEDLNPETHSLAEILQELKDAGASTADIMEIFGVRAGSAIAVLMQEGAPALRQFTEEIKKSGNITDEVVKKQEEAFSEQWKIFQNNLRTLAITIGSVVVPALNSLLQPIIRLIQRFNDLPAPIQKAAGAFIAVSSAAMVAAGALKVVSGVMALLGAEGAISSAIGGLSSLSGALSTVAVAVGLPIPVIGVLLAAIAALAFNVGGARDKFLDFAGKVGNAAIALKDKITELAESIAHGITRMFAPLGGLLEEYFVKPWREAFNKIHEEWDGFTTEITAKVTRVASGIKDGVSAGLSSFHTIVSEKLVVPFQRAISNTRPYLSRIVGTIHTTLSTLHSYSTRGAAGFIAQWKSTMSALLEITRARAGAISTIFLDKLRDGTNRATLQVYQFVPAINAIETRFSTFAMTIYEHIATTLDNLKEVIDTNFAQPWLDAFERVITALTQFTTSFTTAIRAFAGAVPEHISAGLSGVSAVITRFLKTPLQQGITWAKGQFEQLTTYARQGIAGLQTAFAKIRPLLLSNIITPFSQAFTTVTSKLIAFNTEVLSKVQAMVAGLKLRFAAGLATIKTIVTTHMVAPIRAGVTTVQELFRNMISGIRSTLSTVRSAITDPIKNAMNSVVNSIRAAVTNAKNAAANIGRAIVAGIRQGLSNIWNAIKNALLNPIQSAIDEVKNLLGIHSPSRVFMAIGQNVVEGYAEGLKRTFKEVPKTLPTPQPGTPVIPTLTPAPAVGVTGGPREVHIYVDLHGAVIKEEADVDMIVDKIERRLAAYL